MRVAMVTPRYKNDVRGGGEISLQLLVKTLRKQGVEVDVLSGDILFPDEQNTLRLNIKMYRLLKLITNEYDIFHTYNMSLLPAVGLLTRKYNINSIASLNGHVFSPTFAAELSNHPTKERLINSTLLKTTIKHIKRFTTLSKFYKDTWVRDGLPYHKVSVVSNMIPKEYEFAGTIAPHKEVNIIAVGNYAKWRDIDMLIEAYSKLPKQDVVLKIVGQGWRKKVCNYKGKNALWYYPQVRHEDMSKMYAQADIYVQSYKYYGIGRTMLEAAQNKTAIVTTGRKQDFLYLHEYLNYFKDAKMLQKTLQTLIDYRETTKRSGKQVSKIVKKNFNPEFVTKQYIKIYEEML